MSTSASGRIGSGPSVLALWTSRSSRPCRSTSATSSSRWSASVRSPTTTVTPSGRSASLNFSALRPSVITCHPASASAVVRARPSPADPPVTSATRVVSLSCSCHYGSSSSELEFKGQSRMDSRDLLPMGEISQRSGFAASAIRYYEAEGLIEAHRSGGGQRRFERSVLRRLAFIRAASNVGLTIEEIRDELAGCPATAPPPRPTGTASPGTGARASTTRSPRSSGSRAGSTAASAAAASASAPAPSPTPATGPRHRARVPSCCPTACASRTRPGVRRGSPAPSPGRPRVAGGRPRRTTCRAWSGRPSPA